MSETIFEDAVRASQRARVAKLSHPWRYLTGLVGILLAVWFVGRVRGNSALEWTVFAKYFGSQQILQGLWTTLWLTVAVTALSLVLGTLLAAMRLSHNPVFQVFAWLYVWIFRSTPLLVQLLFWFNIGYLVPVFSLGIPWGPSFVSVPSVNIISAVTAALLGLTMHTLAYASEIIRGGILSVSNGQREAAFMLALGPVRSFWRIVLPQSMRTIIPSVGNLLIDTLKSTSIVSVLAVPDLLYSTQLIYNRNYKIIPLLVVATVWYVIVTTLLTIVQHYIERYSARGVDKTPPPSALRRLKDLLPGRAVRGAVAPQFQVDATHGVES